MKFNPLILSAFLASAAYARTDLAGCISSATYDQWHEASLIWYVPGTGEICDIPDCGGGRAPPKHDNPACPLQYTGTATYEPSYLPGYGPGAVASTKTLAATGDAVTTTGDAVTTTATALTIIQTTTFGQAESASSQKTSVIITSSASMPAASPTTNPTTSPTTSPIASPIASPKTSSRAGNSSSVAGSSSSSSAGAAVAGNSASSLKYNAIGVVGAAAVLAACAL